MLVFNQALWFGNSMDVSLIATHQVRSHGLILNDDPFDKGRPFGLTEPDSRVTIPFDMNGSFAGAATRRPTLEEFNDSVNVIEVTSDALWDPTKPTGAQVSMVDNE